MAKKRQQTQQDASQHVPQQAQGPPDLQSLIRLDAETIAEIRERARSDFADILQFNIAVCLAHLDSDNLPHTLASVEVVYSRVWPEFFPLPSYEEIGQWVLWKVDEINDDIDTDRRELWRLRYPVGHKYHGPSMHELPDEYQGVWRENSYLHPQRYIVYVLAAIEYVEQFYTEQGFTEPVGRRATRLPVM